MIELVLIGILILILIVTIGFAFTLRALRRLTRKTNAITTEVHRIAPFVWATSALHRRPELAQALPNWNHWSMPPDTLNQILDMIEVERPKLIVEFGSGISTIAIASKLQLIGGKLVSFEHDAPYAEHVRRMLAMRGLTEFVEFRIAPITSGKYHTYDHPWYDVNPAELPQNADLVIIDGPPASSGTAVRLPAGDLMAERLAPGGSIVFDDAARPGEQEIKEFMKKKYPDFSYSEPPSLRGQLIMKRSG